MAIDQEKLKARRARQNAERKIVREAARIARGFKPLAIQADIERVVFIHERRSGKTLAIRGFLFDSPKVIQHNAELHKTSAYLAEQARAAERAMDRKRWSHAL
jgi:hypothetical protein